ncbi:type 1 periplasmic binding fold superfamily protein [Leeuwenhoekiella sp. W20_SRS_FM14]|uniref:type 1 periplasmic binding fold superfamily protein n=1 Tax=Leeuwenhoekiella sp. W20_SRS_FM14 TaxID=3240270 RepID=UPI003F960141
MKTIKYSILALVALINLNSCSSDDDSTPEIINEEEVITTVEVVLTPTTGDAVTLKSIDLDGDGPNAPVLSVSGPLQVGMLYNGVVTLKNETVSPVKVINEEIEEEADEHQFFYRITGGLDATVTYTDSENDYLSNNSTNPVGLQFSLQANAASSGGLTITLIHEPAKDAAGVVNGDITNAAGETDVEQTFNLSIE